MTGISFYKGEGDSLGHDLSKEMIVVVRYLKSGKSPKEIAFLIHRSSWAVWKIIERYQEIRRVYVRAYPLRYPNRDKAPAKIINPLRVLDELSSKTA